MRFPTMTRNNDFRRAYARGRSFVGYCLILYVQKNRTGGTRIGITSSKKIGNAVQRNRARRVIRAAVDAVLPPEGVGSVDLVLVARGVTAAQKSGQVAAVLRKLLLRAGLPVRPTTAERSPVTSPADAEGAVSLQTENTSASPLAERSAPSADAVSADKDAVPVLSPPASDRQSAASAPAAQNVLSE